MASINMNHHIFGPHEILMKLCGIIPYNLYNPTTIFGRNFAFISKIIDYIVTINLILLTLLYFVTTYISYVKNYGFDEFCDALAGSVIYGYAVIQTLYYKYCSKELDSMIHFIRRNFEMESAPGLTKVNAKISLRKANRFQTLWSSLGLMSVIFFTITEPVLAGELRLHIWYPFNVKKPIIYELVLISQILAEIKGANSYTITSGLYVSMVIFICGQFDILFCNLKNYIATAAIKSKCDDEFLSILTKLNERTKNEPEQYMYAEETEEMFPMVKCSENDIIKYETKSKFRYELKAALKNCVTHHIFILKLFKRFESINHPCLMLKMFCCIFQLCLLGFVAVKSSEQHRSLIQILSFANYISLTIFEAFLFTYYGELLARQSVRLPDALSRAPWYRDMRTIKMDFLIILENCKKPIQFSGGKIFAYNIERFRFIFTTAFSYITILQTLDEGDKTN